MFTTYSYESPVLPQSSCSCFTLKHALIAFVISLLIANVPSTTANDAVCSPKTSTVTECLTNVTEHSPPGTTIFDVMQHFPGISVILVSGVNEEHMASDTQRITTVGNFDREEMVDSITAPYPVYLTASFFYYSGLALHEIAVKILVHDLDDNVPVFYSENTIVTGTFYVETPESDHGKQIASLYAKDFDEGINGTQEYILGEGSSPYFNITVEMPNNGVPIVQLVSNGFIFNCEEQSHHNVFIIAKEGNNAPDSVTLNVSINVTANSSSITIKGSVAAPNTVLASVGDDSVDLYCNFTGCLPSSYDIIWKNEGGDVLEDSTDGYNITTSLGGPGQSNIDMDSGVITILTIKSVEQSDLGTQYTCEIEGTSIKGTIQLQGLPVYSSLLAAPPTTSMSTSATVLLNITSSSSIPLQITSTSTTLEQLSSIRTSTSILLNSITSSSSIPLPAITSSATALSTMVIIIILGVVFPVAVIVVLVTLLAILLYSNYKRKRNPDNQQKLFSDHELRTCNTNSIAEYVDVDAEIQKELEERLSDSLLDVKQLELMDKIGEGQYGVVFRGCFTDSSNQNTVVAVKTLKGPFSYSAINSLIDEAIIMKSFNHLHILPLIGVCLNLNDAPCIVTPLMSEGSLHSYLRKNKANLKVSSIADDNIISESTKKLLSMCLQVAKGMEYLAEMKFVHRDLAARNCMISCDGIIKVADFGLSEDIYETNYFVESERSVRLPIKWMAIESIYYKKFSEKTDVWSYGVLCWEVFSAGSTPYSNMSPREVIRALNKGHRLEKPVNEACSDDTYSLMMSCWDEKSDKRPSFEEVVERIERLIAPLAQYLDFTEIYMNMNVNSSQ